MVFQWSKQPFRKLTLMNYMWAFTIIDPHFTAESHFAHNDLWNEYRNKRVYQVLNQERQTGNAVYTNFL